MKVYRVHTSNWWHDNYTSITSFKSWKSMGGEVNVRLEIDIEYGVHGLKVVVRSFPLCQRDNCDVIQNQEIYVAK